jgi:hypothetical protein
MKRRIVRRLRDNERNAKGDEEMGDGMVQGDSTRKTRKKWNVVG